MIKINFACSVYLFSVAPRNLIQCMWLTPYFHWAVLGQRNQMEVGSSFSLRSQGGSLYHLEDQHPSPRKWQIHGSAVGMNLAH